MNDLIEFHLKNKYYVDVSKTDNGCVAKFPSSQFLTPKIPAQIVEYFCRSDEIIVNLGNNKITYPVVEYARNPLIMADIFLKTSFRKISVKLILLFDGLNRVNKFSNILKGSVSEENQKKEKLIVNSFSDILLGCFSIKDDESNIIEGVNQIVNLIDRRGF
jgi:hypothetical protein